MSTISNIDTASARATVAYLARHVGMTFFGGLAIGVPLAVLPVVVHDVFGFGAGVVGLVIGLESLVTVVTRHFAGVISDSRGAKRAVLSGLPVLALAGALLFVAAIAPAPVAVRLALVLGARVVLGLGESLLFTGAMSWGIAALGAPRAGLVMAWQGIAIFAAFGFGAPLGLLVFDAGGFPAVALAATALPLLGFALAATGRAVAQATAGERVPFHRVVSLIWRQGLVLTLGAVPFAGIAAFLVLWYRASGWPAAGAGLALFSAGYVGVRLVGSHWPDRYGGARVAGVSLAVEAVGQALMVEATGPVLALVGALLTGIGFSLVFPAMGVDATRRVPAHVRGRAVGNFIAFFDLAIGLTGPLVGLLIAPFGYRSVFLVGLLATLAALGLLASQGRTEG